MSFWEWVHKRRGGERSSPLAPLPHYRRMKPVLPARRSVSAGGPAPSDPEQVRQKQTRRGGVEGVGARNEVGRIKIEVARLKPGAIPGFAVCKHSWSDDAGSACHVSSYLAARGLPRSSRERARRAVSRERRPQAGAEWSNGESTGWVHKGSIESEVNSSQIEGLGMP